MPGGFQTLCFYVYDADKVSSGDDILGTVSVTRDYLYGNKNPKGLETWLPLQKANKDLEIQGEMLIEYGVRCSEATGQSFVFVTVIEGRDLAAKDKSGYSDPYVTVTCCDETKSTSKQKKTRFPEWNETLEFLLPEDSVCDLSVSLTVWDKDNFSSDDFMGQIYLDSEEVSQGSAIRKWHAVARRPSSEAWMRRASKVERGKVRLKLQLVEETLLPRHCYTPLVEMLGEAVKKRSLGDMLWDTLEQERSIELSAVATSLVRFYLSQDLIVEFLDAVIMRDIERTEDVNTLFRGNTIGTKAVDNFMKLLAMPYLQSVLKPIIERIINEKKNVELDPVRVNSVRGRRRHSIQVESEESFMHHATAAMEDYLLAVIGSICTSVERCPQVMRRVLRNIQVRVRDKWPEETHEDVPYIAVSGFVFLRFFAPAIMTPKMFFLSDLHPSCKVIRTFTLLAKIVQNVGNLTPSHPGKEVWLEPLAPLISQQLVEVKGYLDELVDVEEFSASQRYLVRQQSNETVLIQGHLHKCHYHSKRLFRPIVLKKCYFYLTRTTLCYRKTPDDEEVMVMVENICAVEKLDYGALGKSNMGQIIYKTLDENTCILYFQAKDVNELTAWISAIRKTCYYNVCRVDTFHPGIFKGDKWNCCRKEQDTAPGCSPTYHGVVLGDWQDPLDPDVDAQIIYSQIAHGKDKIRKVQHDLRMSIASQEPAENSLEEQGLCNMPTQMETVSMMSGLLDVVEQLAMSHQTFVEASSVLSPSVPARRNSSFSGDEGCF